MAVVAIAGAAPAAWAQTGNDWQQGTTLAGFIGAASPTAGVRPSMGAALGWELTPHFTVEGRGLWLDAGPNADAFAAVVGARVPLRPARAVVPFLSAGVGVHRATFDSAPDDAPRFYQRRMRLDAPGFEARTFDDFVVALGGGLDVFLASHLALRPEATVLLVTTRAEAHTVPVFGVHLAYHFESHPITPARR